MKRTPRDFEISWRERERRDGCLLKLPQGRTFPGGTRSVPVDETKPNVNDGSKRSRDDKTNYVPIGQCPLGILVKGSPCFKWELLQDNFKQNLDFLNRYLCRNPPD